MGGLSFLNSTEYITAAYLKMLNIKILCVKLVMRIRRLKTNKYRFFHVRNLDIYTIKSIGLIKRVRG